MAKESASWMNGRARLAAALTATLLAVLAAAMALAKPASAEVRLVEDSTVTIPGNAPGDLDTGIDLQTGDRFVVSASGSFNPGCFLCGDTGPEGYTIIADNRFPLPGVREYSLLGKVNGSYFYIGTGVDRVHQDGPGRLFLRINDFLTADNGGSYTAHIQVFRDVPVEPNTVPTISAVRPVPGDAVRDRTPLISATVRDAQTVLSASNIRLFVDGRPKAFSYNAATDRLTRLSNTLSFGRHTVRIVATDGSKQATRVWSFKVVRR
jgi:hypothetical protein